MLNSLRNIEHGLDNFLQSAQSAAGEDLKQLKFAELYDLFFQISYGYEHFKFDKQNRNEIHLTYTPTNETFILKPDLSFSLSEKSGKTMLKGNVPGVSPEERKLINDVKNWMRTHLDDEDKEEEKMTGRKIRRRSDDL
jgi:hypothetical protein